MVGAEYLELSSLEDVWHHTAGWAMWSSAVPRIPVRHIDLHTMPREHDGIVVREHAHGDSLSRPAQEFLRWPFRQDQGRVPESRDLGAPGAPS